METKLLDNDCAAEHMQVAVFKGTEANRRQEIYLPILICHSGKENLSSLRIPLRHLPPQGLVRSCSGIQKRKIIAEIYEDADDSKSSDLFTFVFDRGHFDRYKRLTDVLVKSLETEPVSMKDTCDKILLFL